MNDQRRLLQLTCLLAGCFSIAIACGSSSEKRRERETSAEDGGQSGAGAAGAPSISGSSHTAGSSQAGSNTPGGGGGGADGQSGTSGQGDGGATGGNGRGADGGQAGNAADGGQAGNGADGSAGDAGSSGAGGGASCSEFGSSVGPNLLNGSFELPALAGPSWVVIAASQEPANFGWSVLADVDVSRAGWTSGQGVVSAPAKEGNQLLDVVAFGSEGALQQTVDVVPGNSYVFALSYANNPVASPPLPTASASVTARVCDRIIFSETISHSTSSKTDFDWTSYSRTFTATDSIVTLEIVETVGGGAGGILIDAVSLAPE